MGVAATGAGNRGMREHQTCAIVPQRTRYPTNLYSEVRSFARSPTATSLVQSEGSTPMTRVSCASRLPPRPPDAPSPVPEHSYETEAGVWSIVELPGHAAERCIVIDRGASTWHRDRRTQPASPSSPV
jgi:hypothetical protein